MENYVVYFFYIYFIKIILPDFALEICSYSIIIIILKKSSLASMQHVKRKKPHKLILQSIFFG